MPERDLRPTFGPIYDQDFVHNISLMHLGLWFGLACGMGWQRGNEIG